MSARLVIEANSCPFLQLKIQKSSICYQTTKNARSIIPFSPFQNPTQSLIHKFLNSHTLLPFFFLAFAQNSDTKLLQVVATKKVLMQYINIFKSLLQQKIIQAHIYVYCSYNVSLLQNSFFFLAMNLLFPIVSIDLSNKKLTKKEMSSN